MSKKYEWEDRIAYWAVNAVEELNGILPENFSVVGIVVENGDTGEGAILSTYKVGGCVIESDVWLDALSDAERIYMETCANRKAEFLRKKGGGQ